MPYMRPLYAQLDWPQEVPAQDVVADDGRGPVSISVPHPPTPKAFTLLQGLTT